MSKMLSYRFPFKCAKLLNSVRFCHNDQNKLEERRHLRRSEDLDNKLVARKNVFSGLDIQYWNERAAIKKEKRDSRFYRTINNSVDFLRVLQSLKNFPLNLTELYYFLKRRRERAQIIEQKYLPRRVAVLKADLAAAHFLIQRGGSVKFLGQQEWIGFREKKYMLPITYVPGLFIEAIKAEGTGLIYEGLQNLSKLKYLQHLSLKNLVTVNDWCLDWISQEYNLTLKHLDISGCVNVTYRGLSCFYRFECLETLNVSGIPDTPEFKVACLMLLEIMPDLDIQGISLDIPEKIEFQEIKEISDSNKQVQQLKG